MLRGFVVAVLFGVLAACGRPAEPARHDLLRIVQTQDFTSLNPVYVSGVGGQQLAALLFSYLVKIDDHGRLVADAAAEIPTMANGGISPDGLRVTYHLRPGLRFSDGTALTGEDVAYTIDALADPRSDAPSRIGFDDVAGTSVPDPLTVIVQLKRPYAPILLYLCGPGNAVPILPRHLLAGSVHLADLPFSANPVGSGPYMVKRWQRGDRLELVPNPYHLGGPPGIADLTIQFVPSSNSALVLLRAGDVDAYVNADDAQLADLRSIARIRVDEEPIDGTGTLIFNTQTLRSATVRRALARALDTRAIIQKTLLGAARTEGPARGLFQWAYDPVAYAMPAYDPLPAGLILRPLHLHLDLVVRADKPSATSIATEIQAAAHTAGVDITIHRYPVATLVAPDGPIYSGKFDLALFAFIAGFDPDVTDQFSCDRVPPHGFNKPRYCNPALDPLLRAATATYDRDKRKAAYLEIQRILARDLPLDTLYQAISINAFPSALKDQTTAVTTPFWNVANWRL
jgi:peptide/nickel transport system substrate-binding protein